MTAPQHRASRRRMALPLLLLAMVALGACCRSASREAVDQPQSASAIDDQGLRCVIVLNREVSFPGAPVVALVSLSNIGDAPQSVVWANPMSMLRPKLTREGRPVATTALGQRLATHTYLRTTRILAIGEAISERVVLSDYFVLDAVGTYRLSVSWWHWREAGDEQELVARAVAFRIAERSVDGSR